MNIKSAFLFAKSLTFPRTSKKSIARKSVLSSIVCVAISVVPLVAVMSVADGVIDGMTDRIIGLSSGNLQSYVYKNSPSTKSAKNLKMVATEIAEIDGVIKTFPEVATNALATGKSSRTGVHIRAVQADIFKENEAFAKYFKVLSGDVDELGVIRQAPHKFSSATQRPENADVSSTAQRPKNAVVGEKVASLLNLKVGEKFRIITTRLLPNGKTVPRLTSFNVSAIVSSGYQELDALWIFVPLETAFSYATKDNSTFSIMIETEDALSTDLYKTRHRIDAKMRNKAVTYTWNELNSSQFENFSSTRLLLLFVMMLIVLVASVNISSALVMLVMERQNEIAILKSVGSSSSEISLSFVIAGVFCAVIGCLIGLAVGVAISLNINAILNFIELIVNFFGKIAFVLSGKNAGNFVALKIMDPAYYLTDIEAKVSGSELALIFFVVTALAIFVSVIPAIQAGRKKPIEILRKG